MKNNAQKRRRRLPSASFSIFFSLDKASDELIRSLAAEIKKRFDTEFVFDGERYGPHITLYLFSAPLRNRQRLIEEVEKLAQDSRQLKLTIEEIVAFKDGWVVAILERHREIYRYHVRTIEAVNALRQGYLRSKYRDKESLTSLPIREQKNLLRYGDRHAKGLFVPHVPLSKSRSQEDAEKISNYARGNLVGRKIVTDSLVLTRDVGGENAGTRVLFKKELS
jgi:2'-5' RNA ligase